MLLLVSVIGCETEGKLVSNSIWMEVTPISTSDVMLPKGEVRVYSVEELRSAGSSLVFLIDGEDAVKSDQITCDLLHKSEVLTDEPYSRTYKVPDSDQYIFVTVWGEGAESRVSFMTYRVGSHR